MRQEDITDDGDTIYAYRIGGRRLTSGLVLPVVVTAKGLRRALGSRRLSKKADGVLVRLVHPAAVESIGNVYESIDTRRPKPRSASVLGRELEALGLRSSGDNLHRFERLPNDEAIVRAADFVGTWENHQAALAERERQRERWAAEKERDEALLRDAKSTLILAADLGATDIRLEGGGLLLKPAAASAVARLVKEAPRAAWKEPPSTL